MKKARIISIALAAFTALQLMLVPTMSVSAASDAGVIINQDASVIAKSITNAEGYKNFALSFEGSGVTDYIISLNSVNAGLTHVKTLCETFPTVGINAWLSFRMNDAQDSAVEVSSLLSTFINKNPGYKRVKTGTNANKYYNNCLDYTYDAVRDHMLGLINTALSNYNCYGIELDFQREIWLWRVGGEYDGIAILNDFMRDVDRLTKVYAAKYGHDIKVSVRCASDLLTNYDFGLDLGTWASEGIIDQVSPTGRFSTTDNDIPVRLWTSFAKPYGITVAPCIEKNIVSGLDGKAGAQTFETITAAAANFVSQGADKVYLYNYHIGPVTAFTAADKVASTAKTLDVTKGQGYWNVISTVGSYDKLMNLNRRMILTYNDTHPLWAKSNAQLPLNIAKNTTKAIRIPVGDIPAGATVTLKFSVNSVSSPAPTVYVNSEAATYTGTATCEGGFTTKTLLCYTVPAGAFDDTYIVAEIRSEAAVTIDYAEVYVKAAG